MIKKCIFGSVKHYQLSANFSLQKKLQSNDFFRTYETLKGSVKDQKTV